MPPKFLLLFVASSDYFNELVKKPIGLVKSMGDLLGDEFEIFWTFGEF